MSKDLKNLITSFGLMLLFLQSCTLVPKTKPVSSTTSPDAVVPVESKPSISNKQASDTHAEPQPFKFSMPRSPVQIESVETIESPAKLQVKGPSPVVVSLLNQASKLEDEGKLATAYAQIERALRHEPKNARLWSRLARIRLLQERPVQAEALARKSNRFAQGDVSVLKRNWQLIVKARESQDDNVGVKEAQKKVTEYSY